MKEKLKSLSLWLVIGVIGVAGVGGVALALSGGFPIGIESCNNCVFNVVEKAQQALEGVLGASGTRMPNGISADSTSPVAGEVRGTTLTITSGTSLRNTLNTKVSNGSFADATTTLFCVPNPFTSTSTVSARVAITGVSTSSMKLYVAPTTTLVGLAYGQLDDNMLIEGAAINTNTLSNIVSGATAGLGVVSSGAGTFMEVATRPGDSVCGQVVAEASVNGAINPLNTFAGTYTLEWKL